MAITKVTVLVELDNDQKKIEFASLGFGGFEPGEHDVTRLFGVVKEKAAARVAVVEDVEPDAGK